jgi:tripartite ATP-independent transporter DctM subunit
MFLGGIVPGVLMVVTLSLFGIVTALRNKVERIPFRLKEAAVSFKESIWEIMLPVIILLGYFLGFTTLVETAAIAVVYSLIAEMFINRDIRFKDLQTIFNKALPIIGGVLIILAVAKGLSYYFVDAEVPTRLTGWVRETIHSKYLFLFLLNIGLLITGCLMDIFSAILVVVPLIIPLAEVFGIHPIHLGIIFLANLELGYLTPPVGLNLFLASYRFEEPLIKVYKDVLPFFFALLVTVLLITYVPWITTGLLTVLGL